MNKESMLISTDVMRMWYNYEYSLYPPFEKSRAVPSTFPDRIYLPHLLIDTDDTVLVCEIVSNVLLVAQL